MKLQITRQGFTQSLVLIPFLFLAALAFGQKTVIVDSTNPYFRTAIAGQEYKTSQWHKWLWGEDYREEWSTPVTFPVLNLDSAYGGLTPLKEGGGRQTKSLHMKDAQGRRYVLRSVNKTYTGALPEMYKGTIIETLANDQIATNHPYGALTIPQMAEAAKVYHTNPKYYVVPYNERLGEYNEVFANTLCMLEEHPDETQVEVESFGHPEDIVSTEKMYEKLGEENDQFMDQHSFVMARLFDMFVGDWGRHPDNWRWAKFDSGSYKIYRPVPKDRDQVYAKFEGLLLSIAVHAAGLKQLQTFDDKIKDIRWYNYAGNELDKRFTNELTRQVWIDSAKALQQYMTDAVIESAVRQMPPEIFAESGEETIEKLKSRRDKLVKYTKDYYDFLAKEVDIAGSKQNEIFNVQRLNDHETLVNIYPVNKHGEVSSTPTFSRTFLTDETKEIRLYGIGGNDVFHVQGNVSNDIKIRVIGGPDKDSVINESSKIKYYDNPGNVVTGGNVKQHLSYDSTVNAYNYERGKFDKKGFIIMPNYANVRGVFFEAGYKAVKQKWRTEPFASYQSIKLNYSPGNKSLGGDYKGIFNKLIGKWDLLLDATYDQVLKNYFFGFGNETPNTEKIEYYKVHTEEGIGSVGLSRAFARFHAITISGFFQSVKVANETDHLTSATPPSTDGTTFDRKNFIGGQIGYSYSKINDAVVPTKGIGFSLNGSHTTSLTQSGHYFDRYWTTLGFYLPLGGAFSFASRNGFYTLDGDPEFYQYNWLGGGQNLRGYHRQRFFGKTSFYTDNELRWIPNVSTYLFKGKMGLIGFVDQGRVWMPNEDSNKWHVGYGGGLLISPFNKIVATAYYGLSEDDHLFHIRLGRFF
jgi:hypothetical protein